MTPLIDVLLVLLIIFLVVTPLRSVGLPAQVPQPPRTETPAEVVEQSVVARIGKDLSLTINRQPVETSALAQRLFEIFKPRGVRVLFVAAHPDVEFQHVGRVIDVARGAGVQQVGLLPDRLP